MQKDLLLYVHIPFCSSKCTFCDWVHEVSTSDLRLKKTAPRRERYIAALIEQIGSQGSILSEKGYVPKLMYWGGGTASILSNDEMERIMTALGESFDLSAICEATLECSPETISRSKLEHAWRLGFRRLSLGIQSLNESTLRILGRAHSADQGADAVRLAAESGFENINIDLLSGAPNETLGDFEQSVRQAMELPASHVSFYPFRPTPGTMMSVSLRYGRFGKLSAAQQITHYDLGREILRSYGFPQYGVTHFGRTRCESDDAYFRLTMDWAGFGSGATSLIDGQFLMSARGRLDQYNSDPCTHDHTMSAGSHKITSRLFYQSLHMPMGAEPRFWEARTGQAFSEILEQSEIQWLMGRLGQHADLTCDPDGVRLNPDKAGHAFIHLLHDTQAAPIEELDKNTHAYGAY